MPLAPPPRAAVSLATNWAPNPPAWRRRAEARMRTLFEIASLIVQTFFGLFLFVLLARFWMQVFRASFRNPVGDMVLRLSNWIVLPTRHVVPQFAGLDLSTALCAFVVEIV